MGAESEAIRVTARAMKAIIAAIEKEIIRLSAKLNSVDGTLASDEYNLRNVVEIRSQMKEMAKRNAPKLIKAFSEKLPDIVEEVLTAYPELGAYGPQIVEDLEKTFTESAEEMSKVLQEEVSRDVTKALRSSILGNVGMDKLHKAIAKKMETSTIQVTTLIERSVRNFADESLRAVGAVRAELTGETMYYLYMGPKDSKNRPFCAVRVDKALTQDAADSLKNTRERFNCRHNLIAVNEDYVKENSVDIFRGIA